MKTRMSDTEETEIVGKEAQDTAVVDVLNFKKQKRIAKSSRLLTQLSCSLSEKRLDRENICQLLVRIDEQKEICLNVLDKLENHKQESMETLKDWISEEAEYQIQASEIKHGFPKVRRERGDGYGSGSSRNGRTFHGKSVDGSYKRMRKCQFCSEIHPIWKCPKYRDQAAEEKWKLVKKFGLCYRCLGDNHLGSACKWTRRCNIDGCNENHHYLLHTQKSVPQPPNEDRNEQVKDDSESGPNTEGDGQRKTYGASQEKETVRIAL